MDTEILIIGAGAVGISIGYVLSNKGYKVILIDKEKNFGCHTSSRNTEIIHAGIYYEPNSYKSTLCNKGKKILYEFCEKYGVKYKKCGKIFVAYNTNQISSLEQTYKRSKENGLNDLIELNINKVKKLEPDIYGKSFLYSPSSGIFDSYSYMETLLNLANDKGLIFAPNCEIMNCEYGINLWEVLIKENKNSSFKINSKIIINSSGNFAIPLYEKIFNKKSLYSINPVKGNYINYNGKHFINCIIYPAIIPGKILERVDAVSDVFGNLKFGPNVERTQNIDDYSIKTNIIDFFYSSIIKYLPHIDKNKLSLGYSGIRPKIKLKKDLYDDFVFEWENNMSWLNLFGIDSPGLTSSLGIGEHVEYLIKLRGF